MKKIQDIFSNLINLVIFDLSKVKENTRREVLALIILFISILTWSNRIINGWQLRYIVITLIGCALLYVVVALLFPIKYENKKISYLKVIFWGLMSAIMIISALIHRIDNLLFPFLLLFVFPVVWFVESRIENEKFLFECVAKGLIMSFLLFFFLSLLFSPITMYQYTGIFTNCNGTSQYLTAVLPCILYLISKEDKIRYLVYTAFLCTIMLYTRSRTGLLAMIVIFISWILIEAKEKCKTGEIKKLFKNLIFIVLLIILVFPAFWGLNRVAMYTIQDKFCLNAYEEIMRERGQTIYDTSFNYLVEGLDDRVAVGDRDINAYSSGRVAIWKDYVEELNLSGHSANNGEFSLKHSTAHNVFLQIAYDYGIVAGIMYFIIVVCLLFLNLFYVWRSYSHEMLFSLMIMFGYVITALLASCVFPFSYLISFLFYLVLYKSIYQLENQEVKKEL